MDVLFLGVNDVGMRIYDWLCDRDGVTVQALVTEKEQLSLVTDLQPELIVSVGFDHLVPGWALETPSEGAINLHPSYLPYNRGKSPNVWSIVDGTPAGVTLHYMDEEFDTGDVIARRKVETRFSDTGKDLHRRLERAQFELFTEVWPDIKEGTTEEVAQESDAGTYHTTQDFVEACRLDPDETVRVKDLLDRLRALTFPPFDNAHLEIDGGRYYVNVDIYHEDDTPAMETDGLIEPY